MSDADDRYNQSAKGRARHRRYNRSKKGRNRSNRYEESHVVLGYEHYCGVSGYTRKVRVPRTPEAEAAALRIAAKWAEFKERKQEEYRKAAEAWRAEANAMFGPRSVVSGSGTD